MRRRMKRTSGLGEEEEEEGITALEIQDDPRTIHRTMTCRSISGTTGPIGDKDEDAVSTAGEGAGEEVEVKAADMDLRQSRI